MRLCGRYAATFCAARDYGPAGPWRTARLRAAAGVAGIALVGGRGSGPDRRIPSAQKHGGQRAADCGGRSGTYYGPSPLRPDGTRKGVPGAVGDDLGRLSPYPGRNAYAGPRGQPYGSGLYPVGGARGAGGAGRPHPRCGGSGGFAGSSRRFGRSRLSGTPGTGYGPPDGEKPWSRLERHRRGLPPLSHELRFLFFRRKVGPDYGTA